MFRHILTGSMVDVLAISFLAAGSNLDMKKMHQKNIVETAIAAGQFNTLVTAVRAGLYL